MEPALSSAPKTAATTWERLLLTLETGLPPLSNIVLGLLRAKVTAIAIGATGTAVIGQLNTLINLTLLASTWGMPTALVAEASRARSTGDAMRTVRLRSTLLVTMLVFTLLLTGGLLCIRGLVSEWLFGVADLQRYVPVIAVGLVALAVGTAYSSFVVAERRVRAAVASAMLGSVLSTLQTVSMTWLYGLDGAVWALTGSALTGALVAVVVCHSQGISVLAGQALRPDTSMLRTLLRWGSVGTMTSIGVQVSDAVVKSIVIRSSGLEVAGLYQATLNLSSQYMSLLLASLTVFLLPRLAELKEPVTTSAECNQSLRVVFALAAPVLVAISCFAGDVLSVVYTRSFGAGADLLALVVVSDVFKILAKTTGTLVVARGHLLPWLAVDLAYAIGTPLLTAWWYPTLGASAAPCALASTTCVAALAFSAAASLTEGFRLDRRNRLILVALASGLSAMALLRVVGASFMAQLSVAAVTFVAVEWLAARGTNWSAFLQREAAWRNRSPL